MKETYDGPSGVGAGAMSLWYVKRARLYHAACLGDYGAVPSL